MESNTSTSLFELQVDHESSTYLRESARWAKFLAIVGFIGCGLGVLAGIFLGTYISNASSMYGGRPALGGAFYTIFYIILAGVYFFPCLYTYNFAGKMQAALRSNDQDNLNQAFRNMKSCYRFLGILTIVSISLCLLFMIFGVIGLIFR